MRDKKILRTPLQGILPTSTAATFSLFLYCTPSLSPSSLFLHVTESVTVSGRGEDLSRNTNTHHLNENSSLPPPQLSVLNPHTHKHITIDCHVQPRYPLQPSWLLDSAWQFKCIQKKLERSQTAILFCPLQRRVKNYNCFILASAEWTNNTAEVTGSEREDIYHESHTHSRVFSLWEFRACIFFFFFASAVINALCALSIHREDIIHSLPLRRPLLWSNVIPQTQTSGK